MTGITLDGKEYRVRVKYQTLTRAFSIMEGQNSGESISGRTIRDIIGTKYNYQLSVEPNSAYPEDYDAFYYAISAPQDTHTVVLPFGQTTISFSAMVESGSDTYQGINGGYERWGGLTVTFTAIEPQRT